MIEISPGPTNYAKTNLTSSTVNQLYFITWKKISSMPCTQVCYKINQDYYAINLLKAANVSEFMLASSV